MKSCVLLITFILCVVSPSFAADPDMLQDTCVADLKSDVQVNGFTCKPAANVSAADFFFAGIANPGNTNNLQGAVVTAANVMGIPGLNTLGVSMARIDYAPGGQNPPHTHPRATEIIYVLYGQLDVAFITTNNKLIGKTLYPGEVFVFPRGLVHFQKNNGKKPAAVIAGFNSQLPGTQGIAVTLFTSDPPVPNDVLTKAFQIDNEVVEKSRKALTPKA